MPLCRIDRTVIPTAQTILFIVNHLKINQLNIYYQTRYVFSHIELTFFANAVIILLSKSKPFLLRRKK